MIITVNSIPYTVLPFLANWNAQAPKWTLTWDTEIDQALRGYESRGAYRTHPRPRLSFAVDVDNAGEVMNLLRSAFRVLPTPFVDAAPRHDTLALSCSPSPRRRGGRGVRWLRDIVSHAPRRAPHREGRP